MPVLLDSFFPVYASNAHAKDDNILFGLKHNKKYIEAEGKQKIEVAEQLIKP